MFRAYASVPVFHGSRSHIPNFIWNPVLKNINFPDMPWMYFIFPNKYWLRIYLLQANMFENYRFIYCKTVTEFSTRPKMWPFPFQIYHPDSYGIVISMNLKCGLISMIKQLFSSFFGNLSFNWKKRVPPLNFWHIKNDRQEQPPPV